MRAAQVQTEALSATSSSPSVRHVLFEQYFDPYYANVFAQDEAFLKSKRAFDLAVSLLVAPILLPLCGLIALAIRLESSGPVIFRQVRIGRNGKAFQMYKFRSMRIDAEAKGAAFAAQGDSRITRLGRILRKYRLDELPQFWNVFRGDMSIIGPRPEQAQFVEEFKLEIFDYSLRHLVRPGITGWAQVHQGYCASVNDTKKKLRYDLFYIKNISWKLDLIILVRTVKTILTGFGYR